MYDPTYPLYPVFAFIGFVVALIPLPWHLQAWNSGTCFYMIWAALACLNQFINSVIWAGNAINSAPIWCDISTRIMLGASVGLPAASLCINRRLYHIASVRSVSVGRAEKSRVILIDSMICVLFPVIFVALQYVVQGHRFNIYEDIGCYPAIYNTLPAYFLSAMWPIVIGLISATYCILSLRAFACCRLEFSQFLASNKDLTISRYFRLMALAMTEILLTTPLAIFTMWLNSVCSPIQPWISWADTHYNFSHVGFFPATIWRNGGHALIVGMELSRWVIPLSALVFFAFFGFAEEAKRNYRAAFACSVRSCWKPHTCPSAGKIFNDDKYSPHIKDHPSSPPPYSFPSSAATRTGDTKKHLSLTSSFNDAQKPTFSELSKPPRTIRGYTLNIDLRSS